MGFFARQADEYEWLRAFLSKKTLVKLLAREYTNNRIERVELPGIMAVHFVGLALHLGPAKQRQVIHDYLDTGVSATTRLNNLGVCSCCCSRRLTLF